MKGERDRHLFSAGPKRILALDGGGVRGIISLAFLERIENILTERAGRRVLLSEYFDLIGGTSTGALIATGLAMGMSVAELIDMYLRLAGQGFSGKRWYGGLLVSKFRTAPLLAQIRAQVGDATLGSERILTGLAIVAKRIDTGSVWVFHNNPRGKYFGPDVAEIGGLDIGAVPNRDLPLVQLLRASTAAPTFFAPERIEIARGVRGVFVDGGVSPHNNPALLMLLLANLRGYGFAWPLGEDEVQIVSVGTGHRPLSPSMLPPPGAPAATLAILALRSVLGDCSALAQTMLQWLGRSPVPWEIDSEIGDLNADCAGPTKLFRYQRYELWMERSWLSRMLGRDLTDTAIAALDRFDEPSLVSAYYELGAAAAERQVHADHFPPGFDPDWNRTET